MAIEIVDLPIKHGGSSIVFGMFTRPGMCHGQVTNGYLGIIMALTRRKIRTTNDFGVHQSTRALTHKHIPV